MYGLLIESLAEYLRTNYGDDTWEAVRRASNLPHATFNTHSVYPENTIPMIVEAASEVLGVSIKELMENLGVFFVCFVGRYGYDRVLSVLGRHMRDFLNGLDNLHEYLRFSYPRMRPPSFFCENENSKGLTLHYRTKRSGFLYYTMGQIKAVGQHYYNTPVEIELVSEEVIHGTLNVVFQLHFDNSGFDKQKVVVVHEEHFLPIRAHVFFDIFPFAIVFDSQLIVKVIGNSLHATMPDAVGRKFTDIFNLIRPLIEFTWPSILSRTNNIFELVSAEPIHHPVYEDIPEDNRALVDDIFGDQPHDKCLHLKGQMLYMEDWQGIIYLGTPVMPDLETMVQTGLYINDLSMHDFSRDLMLAGTQQSVELKLALDQEQQKTMKLEESMRKLDEEMKRTDELLYQMIPKAVADRLRNGEPAVGTCEVFDCVTILFSDVVTFTEICSRISPMEVVSLLNCMYSLFDRLTEKHGVYKVETIGDAYMVVSGAPERRDNHAVQVCDMALDMIEVITGLRDPSTGSSIRIRIGIHSGMVVAGVVGVKMPRYCLFGDTVNTASRMESNSEPMKIHISEASQHLIPGNLYTMKERGTIPIKGKGNMKTYWLESKSGYEPPSAKLGASSSSNRGTVLYSPVMFGDSILSRNSLAYSVLSDYSCPRASAYSSVAKVGTRASISVDDWTREGPSTPKEALGMGGNRGGTGQSGREVPFLRNRAYSSPGLQGDRRPLLADSGKLKDTSLPTVSLASGTHCTGNCKSSYCAVQ